ncbi:MAG: flavin reductase [Oscillospiraceae bacterium]|nr:flavin reductase [Oscillospiraceae bacterium]
MKEITLNELSFNPWDKISKEWFLLTSGDENSYNTMTASWGFTGFMWRKPLFTAVVRPTRYTYEFMEKNDLFTVSFFDEKFRPALNFCGSYSGRDVDKAQKTGLDPLFIDGTTAFEQAEMVLVCKKIYAQDMDLNCLADEIKPINGNDPIHKQYIGEILKVYVKD